MSGGDESSRAMSNCVPAGTCTYGAGHEFSGVTDLTGMLAKNPDGSFKIAAGDGHAKRLAEASKPINEHTIAFGLQAHGVSALVVYNVLHQSHPGCTANPSKSSKSVWPFKQTAGLITI